MTDKHVFSDDIKTGKGKSQDVEINRVSSDDYPDALFLNWIATTNGRSFRQKGGGKLTSARLRLMSQFPYQELIDLAEQLEKKLPEAVREPLPSTVREPASGAAGPATGGLDDIFGAPAPKDPVKKPDGRWSNASLLQFIVTHAPDWAADPRVRNCTDKDRLLLTAQRAYGIVTAG